MTNTSSTGTRTPKAAIREQASRTPATIGLGRRRGLIGMSTAAATLGVGLGVPWVVLDRYYISLLFDGIVLAMLALSIGFLARHLGLISLGHTAFFGGAAYLVAMAVTHWGWSLHAAALFGFVGGTVLALLIGMLVVKFSGMGFLMLTLALGQALYQLSIQRVAIPYTGAYDGLHIAYQADATFLGLAPMELMNGAVFWRVVWSALVVVALLLWMIGRSKFGTVMEGVRENEERMRFSGFNTYWPRVVAFVVSGAVAALAGVFFALNAAYVSPELLSFLQAGDALIAAIIGGLGTLIGPILGGVLYIFAQAQFNVSGNLHLFMGITLILVLMFLPGGLTGGLSSLWRRLRRSRKKESS